MRALTEKIISRIAAVPALFLFLDYDGTLTPIASGPSKARLSPRVRRLLKKLKSLKDVRVAIVSGRSLANLKQYVRIPGLIYAGNHGFEAAGPGLAYVHPAAAALEPVFRKCTRRLRKIMAPFRGILIEHKRFSVSVHYRQVRSSGKVREARRLLMSELRSLRHTPVVLAAGKKVWEIRPTREWHKGETVAWLLRRAGNSGWKKFFPVYVGDDTTDEDAFRAIRKSGIGIKVNSGGGRRSSARYFVRSTGEAVRFLEKIIRIRTAKGC